MPYGASESKKRLKLTVVRASASLGPAEMTIAKIIAINIDLLFIATDSLLNYINLIGFFLVRTWYSCATPSHVVPLSPIPLGNLHADGLCDFYLAITGCCRRHLPKMRKLPQPLVRNIAHLLLHHQHLCPPNSPLLQLKECSIGFL